MVICGKPGTDTGPQGLAHTRDYQITGPVAEGLLGTERSRAVLLLVVTGDNYRVKIDRYRYM